MIRGLAPCIVLAVLAVIPFCKDVSASSTPATSTVAAPTSAGGSATSVGGGGSATSGTGSVTTPPAGGGTGSGTNNQTNPGSGALGLSASVVMVTIGCALVYHGL